MSGREAAAVAGLAAGRPSPPRKARLPAGIMRALLPNERHSSQPPPQPQPQHEGGQQQQQQQQGLLALHQGSSDEAELQRIEVGLRW